ncbi:carboxymuconolactone decarboxylase [Spirosoma sp. HMF4905]|uniref:Carboxymuconolactone decarboxylase n=1 Tax=Spirosoma arboris TaxID=2682092 RepID=A0A7K1SMQ1_9BACT|nr:carboxymuconolactone decarboxylase family protein [Spirosoma arboris]MVM35047.1 carboxymuconolactone decarboxylase [Spirosoma arboris]
MKPLCFSIFLTFLVSLVPMNPINAQTNTASTHALDDKQQSLVTISALTATGDLVNLKTALNVGLDAGMTINEIKEALVQLYAYCGFPRSLNGLNTLMTVLDERKVAGKTDVVGRDATPVSWADNKYETGKKTLETLTKMPDKGPTVGANGFAPIIDTFLKEHLFADIFSRDILTYQQRELVTVSALAAMSGVAPQLQAHIGLGMNTGLTEAQLSAAFQLIDQTVSKSQGDLARATLANVLAARKK